MIDRARVNDLRDEVGAEDLAEVVRMFCEEVEETLDRLRSRPSRSLADDLHFLKGSALNIGMSEVGTLCQSFEASLRADPSAIPDVARIATAFARAREALLLELDG
jgi:HPt (histidine-containing phosphotransfer) domain-containing protein